MNRSEVVWNLPKNISPEDHKILFEEELIPGSLWEISYSDLYLLTWNKEAEEMAKSGEPILPGTLERFCKIREDVSPTRWKELENLSDRKLVRKSFPPNLSAEEAETLMRSLDLWVTLRKGKFVMLTEVRPVRSQDRNNLTWSSPMKFTFIYEQKVHTTCGMDLNTWFDLFEKKVAGGKT